MSEQLNQAYNLIKEGQNQAAIDILEPLIRSERDNEDAWWLLANASNDPAAKRNALSNVLRLTNNETRKTKAQAILQQLDDDPFDFDIGQPQKVGMSSYQALDDVAQKKSSGLSCATISLILVGIVGVCACIAGFGIYSIFGDMFKFISAPSDYIDYGVIEDGDSLTGELTTDAPTAGYQYTGTEGEVLSIEVSSNAETAPFIVIYNLETQIFISLSQTQYYETEASTTIELPSTGDYLVTVRSMNFLDNNVGIGEYTIEFDIQ
jgi:hypothetical protein